MELYFSQFWRLGSLTKRLTSGEYFLAVASHDRNHQMTEDKERLLKREQEGPNHPFLKKPLLG
jgi:hypothetical protein